MAKYIVDIPDGYTFCGRCPYFTEGEREDVCNSDDGLQLFNCEMEDLSKMTFLKRLDEDTLVEMLNKETETISDVIEFACDWIRNRASVPFDGDCDSDGHPLPLDYINWAKQRLEYADELCDDFRNYINQRKNEHLCTDVK